MGAGTADQQPPAWPAGDPQQRDADGLGDQDQQRRRTTPRRTRRPRPRLQPAGRLTRAPWPDPARRGRALPLRSHPGDRLPPDVLGRANRQTSAKARSMRSTLRPIPEAGLRHPGSMLEITQPKVASAEGAASSSRVRTYPARTPGQTNLGAGRSAPETSPRPPTACPWYRF
jgi:hypothetical protein